MSLAPLGLLQSHNLEGGPGKEPLARCAEQILAPKFYGSRLCDQPVGRIPKDTEVAALLWERLKSPWEGQVGVSGGPSPSLPLEFGGQQL